MLTPDYLLHVSEGAERIAQELHEEIISRIVERMILRANRGENYILTSQDKWQLEVIQEAGYLISDIQNEIAKKSKKQDSEIKDAMYEAGVRTLTYDDSIYRDAGLSPIPLDKSPHLLRIIERNFKVTAGEWENYTRTTANATQQAFIKAMDRAYTLTSSGMMPYTQAFAEAISEAVAEGVRVYYPSGHSDTLETAALRALRTGISQMSGEITNARMEEMGWDIILVSAHLGARVGDEGENLTNHYWWQGKFYSKSGADKRFLPYSVCGEGNVRGIHGANCRHSHGPGDGVNNPFEDYDSEENKMAYDLSQKQRTLERRIRKTKRQVVGLKKSLDVAENDKLRFGLDLKYQKKAALLQKQNKAYNDFCKENNLKKLNERIKIAEWDRKQAAAARGAAKRLNAGTKQS